MANVEVVNGFRVEGFTAAPLAHSGWKITLDPSCEFNVDTNTARNLIALLTACVESAPQTAGNL